jgi:non-ribosomal peptide synthetase component E (peptide arylation enzyme)
MIITKKLLQSNDKAIEKEAEKQWSLTIRKRDNFSCVICGNAFKPNAHHIIPREHKQYKYELDNGISLCTKHHKYSRVISAHNNPIAFFLWLCRFYPLLANVAIERNKELLKLEDIKLD